MVDNNYWNSRNIKVSKYYQYDVYIYAQNLIKKNKINSVLDIGCGTALKLNQLIKPYCKQVYGIDQKHIINYCKKSYNNIKFYEDDFNNTKLNLNKKFDLIICSDVIEHIKNPQKLLNYIKKYCHKNTKIIISTPEKDINLGKINKEHVREWNTPQLRTYLWDNNFVVLEHIRVKKLKFALIPSLLLEYINGWFNGSLESCQLVLCEVLK